MSFFIKARALIQIVVADWTWDCLKWQTFLSTTLSERLDVPGWNVTNKLFEIDNFRSYKSLKSTYFKKPKL